MSKPTLVLGASTNTERYSNRAIKKLSAHGHAVYAIGNKTGSIMGITINTDKIIVPGVDTVSLYLNPARQQAYYNYIIALKPRRIIFNPGTENDTLKSMANDAGIQTIEACTLVLLSTGQY